MNARPPALDVTSRSQQEVDDEAFVSGILGLHSSRGPPARANFSAKHGSLTSPRGEVEDTKQMRTRFGVHTRLPHQTSTSTVSGSASPTEASVRAKERAMTMLQDMRFHRSSLHHHHFHHHHHHHHQQQQHAVAAYQEQQQRQEVNQRTEPTLSETASVASFGTSISQASTRIMKEPMRPSWMPLRASKGVGNRRVQGAGLLHVAGRIAKEQVDTSLRDKYQEQQQRLKPGRSPSGVRYEIGRDAVRRVGRPATTKVTGETATTWGREGIDDAKELRRVFKMHLHTLPDVEGVKMLEDDFETAALFRKPSRLSTAERQEIFAKLASLRQDADNGGGARPPPATGENMNDGKERDRQTVPVGEEIQSRFARLGLLAAQADKVFSKT